MTRLFITLLLAASAGLAVGAQGRDYVIGAQDVLAITVFDQDDLSGTFNVESDGTIAFPLVGRIKAEGLTLREVETELVARLADGYLKKPQVTAAVEQYRSQRIFIIGEVRSPGAYQLSGNMTLIEALARAGSTTASAGGQVLILRSQGGPGEEPVTEEGPLSEDDEATEVIRVALKDLQSGSLLENAALRDGDTIVVPRTEMVYISGQVNSPGAYPTEDGMTVRQALALAGGISDRGSDSRIKIIRIVDGEQQEIKVKLNDEIEPGDTIVVPHRFF